MEALKVKIIQFLLKRYALGYLVKAWTFSKGYKTQICMALMAIVWVAQTLGYITPELANQLHTALGSGASFAFLQKLQRYQPEIENLVKEVKKG